MNRRQFITRAAIGASAVPVASFAYWKFELHHLEVVERTLPIVGLPPSLDGKRLVQLSDLHIGPVVDIEYARRALRLASSLKPDIVVFTGDFVTWRGRDQLAQLDYVLQDIPKSAVATVAVLGNHDYGFGWNQSDVARSVIDVVASHGIKVFRNSVHCAEGLNFICIDDLWAGRANVKDTRALANADVPSLALCHNPDTADDPSWEGYRGWILSGHTHGGQCKPPFLPPPMLPVQNKRYAAGEVSLGEGRTVYINRGIGYTLPIRVNVRPEVTSFRLVRA